MKYSKVHILIVLIFCFNIILGQQRAILNGGFEIFSNGDSINLSNSSPVGTFHQDSLFGWSSTDWGVDVITSVSGNWNGIIKTTIVDPDKYGNVSGIANIKTNSGSIYQEVCMLPGENLKWEFMHQGRFYDQNRTDSLAVIIDGNEEMRLGTTSNWVKYDDNYLFSGSTPKFIRFELKSVYVDNVTGVGNLLDLVKITNLKPFVSLSSARDTIYNGDNDFGTNILVDGVVEYIGSFYSVILEIANFDLSINYLDTIMVPIGIYDGTIKTAIPISIPDELGLTDELSINIFSVGNGLHINSEGACGKEAITISEVKNQKSINTQTIKIQDNFSPNGDGENDYLSIPIEGKIEIHDESGSIIGTITGPLLWNGITNEGLILEQGFYIFEDSKGEFHELTVFK